MKVSVIADYDTVVGFRLAGVREGYPVDSPEEALERLREIVKKDEVGLVIVTERLVDKIRGDVDRLLEKRNFPLLVEIPDKKGAIEKKVDPLKELVRRAVGVDIKIE
ncbi:V-type ATP synthase subunit F [Candidatus Pyrohabitans sp.]